jgi:hypothetical protein
MTDKPAIADLLAAGRMDYETPEGGWRAADPGLRGEVIEAALKMPGPHLANVYAALLKGASIRFRDDGHDLTVRWSAG